MFAPIQTNTLSPDILAAPKTIRFLYAIQTDVYLYFYMARDTR